MTDNDKMLEILGISQTTPQQKRPRMRSKESVNPLSAAIATERVRLGYTQKDLSERVGIGFETMRRIEQGNQKVQIGIYFKVMEFLGLVVSSSRKSEAHVK